MDTLCIGTLHFRRADTKSRGYVNALRNRLEAAAAANSCSLPIEQSLSSQQVASGYDKTSTFKQIYLLFKVHPLLSKPEPAQTAAQLSSSRLSRRFKRALSSLGGHSWLNNCRFVLCTTDTTNRASLKEPEYSM